MIQTSRGLKPGNQGNTRSGTIGSTMLVIASKSSVDCSSADVIRRTQACNDCRAVNTPAAATAMAAVSRGSPSTACAPSAK